MRKNVRIFGKIPLWLIATVLVAIVGVAAATVYLSAIQHISQKILLPPNYGTLTVSDITLDDVYVGQSFSQSINPFYEPYPDPPVVLELGPDGVGKYLHVRIDEESISLYEKIRVQIMSPAEGGNPMGTCVFCTVGKGYGDTFLEMSWGPLTEEGTYIFSESIMGMAGAEGTADVQIYITLEDEPAEVNQGPTQ